MCDSTYRFTSPPPLRDGVYRPGGEGGGSGAILQELSHLYDLVLSNMQISKIYLGICGTAAKLFFFRLEMRLVSFTIWPKKVCFGPNEELMEHTSSLKNTNFAANPRTPR